MLESWFSMILGYLGIGLIPLLLLLILIVLIIKS